MPDRAARLWIATFATAVAIAYSSALRAPFVFDDLPSVRQNPSIQTLWPLSVPLNPPANTTVAGRPVANLTLAVNVAINRVFAVDPNGPNATLGFHLGNVLIHLVTALVLFAFLRRTVRLASPTSDADAVAGVATLIWLVHPIQSEAVVYVVQRTELLVSLFYLGTLYCSLRAWDAAGHARRWWLAAAVASCALGMGSKEVMITAPLIVILYDLAFRGTNPGALLRERRWLYAALAATSLITIAPVALGARDRSVGFALGLSSLDYALTQCWAVARYVRLILGPVGLNFDYGDQAVDGLAWIPGALLIAALLAATFAAWSRPRWRWAGFAGAWFFLLLAPSSSIVPIRTEVAAERRVYLASVAVIVLVVVAADALRRRWRLGAQAPRLAVGAVATVLLLATWTRASTYNDIEGLYRDVIAKSPGNARGYLGVGLTLMSRGPEHAQQAEIQFRKAIAADTTSFLAWQSLGVLQLTQARWQDAAYTFERSLRIEPGNLDAISGAARAHIELQDANAAMPLVDKLGGRNAPALWALGNLLVHKGRGPEAVRYLELAAATNKPSSLGVALLSLAYAQSANVARAEQAARVATANAGDTADVYNLAARAMIVANRPIEARAYLNAALLLEPNSASLRQALTALDSLQAKKRAQ